MVRVTGIDHLAIRVSDYEKSKAFYGRLFKFLGFELSDEYEDAIENEKFLATAMSVGREVAAWRVAHD